MDEDLQLAWGLIDADLFKAPDVIMLYDKISREDILAHAHAR